MPINVVIVDDEPLARRGLVLRLGQIDGVQIVAECSNGREALLAVVEHQPDLLLLDIQMPGMSGFDVVKNLQLYGEDRCELFGRIEGCLYVLIYTPRHHGTRIISARKANSKEVKRDENRSHED